MASAKWKELIGKPDKINDLILKTKADLKERSDNISYSWLQISYHLEREREDGGGVRLELDVQGQGDGGILNVAGQGRWGIFKIVQFSWTSYVYCH